MKQIIHPLQTLIIVILIQVIINKLLLLLLNFIIGTIYTILKTLHKPVDYFYLLPLWPTHESIATETYFILWRCLTYKLPKHIFNQITTNKYIIKAVTTANTLLKQTTKNTSTIIKFTVSILTNTYKEAKQNINKLNL